MCASSMPSTTRRPPARSASHCPVCCSTCRCVDFSSAGGSRCATAPNGIAATAREATAHLVSHPGSVGGGERFAGQPGLAHPRRPGQQQPAVLVLTEGPLDDREFLPPPDQRPMRDHGPPTSPRASSCYVLKTVRRHARPPPADAAHGRSPTGCGVSGRPRIGNFPTSAPWHHRSGQPAPRLGAGWAQGYRQKTDRVIAARHAGSIPTANIVSTKRKTGLY